MVVERWLLMLLLLLARVERLEQELRTAREEAARFRAECHRLRSLVRAERALLSFMAAQGNFKLPALEELPNEPF